jgi:hypothetical protein
VRLPNRDQMSCSACQIGPSASFCPWCSQAPQHQQRQRRHLPGHPEGPVEPGSDAEDVPAQPAGAAGIAAARRPPGRDTFGLADAVTCACALGGGGRQQCRQTDRREPAASLPAWPELVGPPDGTADTRGTKWGPNVLFCMPNSTKCILLVLARDSKRGAASNPPSRARHCGLRPCSFRADGEPH